MTFSTEPRKTPLAQLGRPQSEPACRAWVNVKRFVVHGEKTAFCVTELRVSRKERLLSFFNQHDVGVVASMWLQE